MSAEHAFHQTAAVSMARPLVNAGARPDQAHHTMRVRTIRQLCARPGRSSAVGRRGSLTSADRSAVLEKTGGTCHVCGGRAGKKWQADHVIPHRQGGRSDVQNYLPIFKEYNRLRWFHSPEVIRIIMRLGIYAKLEIRHETELGERLVGLLRKRLRENRDRRRRRRTCLP